MKRWNAMLIATFVVCACQQNPFPESSRLSGTPPPPSAPPPPVQHDPSPIRAYVLTVPDVMVFHEKEERVYTIQASVPPPGRPIVTATGLPPGAHLSQDGLELSWMPLVDPNQPQQPYVVHFMLQSTEDSVLTYTHNAVLVVEGPPPGLQLAQMGSSVRIPFSVDDSRTQIRIEPKSATRYVQWRNQELVFTPRTEGLVQFQAVVVLPGGEERRESFSFWVTR